MIIYSSSPVGIAQRNKLHLLTEELEVDRRSSNNLVVIASEAECTRVDLLRIELGGPNFHFKSGIGSVGRGTIVDGDVLFSFFQNYTLTVGIELSIENSPTVASNVINSPVIIIKDLI